MEREPFSPRQFLEARRPERFSDSVLEEGRVLGRSMLEYHLDSLTSRSQEADFERFARGLAEREVCPNLLPQTGPTGGGDSKVDAETYPVADDLALVWYVGIGREAASERWAFAFSTKKRWRDKVQSDVKKIAETNRGYSKAFFITNQYVRDKTRADVEDKLSEACHMDVRILDRSWILDRVFEGGHESLAIEQLHIQTSVDTQVRKGPLDLSREEELTEVEARIKAAPQQGRLGFQFVNDCLEAATLARSLERPRTDVEGLFSRAERVAEKYGTPQQKLASAYQAAWTAYWWYEDYNVLADMYGKAEKHAAGAQSAYDLELLTNLWCVLQTCVKSGNLDEATAKLQERTRTLTAELERLSTQQDRPSTALQARTLLLEMRLVSSIPGNVDTVLRELREVVQECKGLLGYPLEPLVEMLLEFGKLVGEHPTYGKLFESIVEVASAREGEVSAARILLKRGAQQLDADRPYEAIRSLGRALVRLYKHESRDDLVRALYLCGEAYERVDLLWAARGTLLAAASVAIDEFWAYAKVTPLQAICCNRVKWLELRLGRLPQTLAWHEVDCAFRGVLADQGYKADRLAQREMQFDAILGILLLRTDIWDLKFLSSLPDVLDRLGLHCSAVALQYALGHEDELPEEFVGDKISGEKLYHFFEQWRDQPAAGDLPATPSLYEQRTVTLNSNVLGCRITAESENTTPCVELAEWMLAALESLLSTGMLERVVAREPVLTIKLRKSDFVEPPFAFEIQERDGRPHLEVRCAAFDAHMVSHEAQGHLKDKMLEVLPHLLARVFMLGESEQVIVKLFRDELALERSINFTSSFVTLGNVLGDTPKTTISAWSSPDVRDYPLKRDEEWDATDRRAKAISSKERKRPELAHGTGEPPAEVRDKGRTKHTEIETVSLIREVLWNQAQWAGTAYAWDMNNLGLPVLALCFRNAEAAVTIFRLWLDELGPRDSEERLRLTIIRGISRGNPNAYRIVIGSNPRKVFSDPNIKRINMVFRVNTMEPQSGQNLEHFLSHYQKHGKYKLTLATSEADFSKAKRFDASIEKRELYVREAWEIGRNDPDCIGIREDDDVIIPEGQENAPVLELLRRKT